MTEDHPPTINLRNERNSSSPSSGEMAADETEFVFNDTCIDPWQENASVSCSYHASDNIYEEISFYVYLYKVTTPVLFALIILTGLVGNSLVIFVTLTQQKMRTSVNLFLLNLAFSDLTFLVICVPFMAYHYAAENWLIGEAACKLSQYILYVTVYVTAYTLVSISVARFLHIVCAQREVRTRGFIGGLVGAIWVAMLTVNVPILLIYRVKQFPPGIAAEPYYYCGMDAPEVHGRRLFLSFFVLTYLAPLTTIATMYLLILRYLNRKQRRSSIRLQRKATTTSTVGEAGTRSGRATRRNSHATRISIAIVVVFGMCWLPLNIHLLIAYYGVQPASRSYEVFRLLCHVFAYSNSCMNPFIYHYVSTDFRQSLRNMLPTCFRRSRTELWQPETVLRYMTRQGETREWTQ